MLPFVSEAMSVSPLLPPLSPPPHGFLTSTVDVFFRARGEAVRDTQHEGDLWSSVMRSEGFPFIVGFWGWTCVRVVLSSCRRVGQSLRC